MDCAANQTDNPEQYVMVKVKEEIIGKDIHSLQSQRSDVTVHNEEKCENNERLEVLVEARFNDL